MYKLLFMAVLSFTLIACSGANETAVAELETTSNTSIEAEEIEVEEDIMEQLPMPSTLEGAIDAYTPITMDFYNEFPTVLGAYALWNQSVGTSWNEINKVEKTSYGKIMKDPTAEYGKRLCVTGNIIEIETDRSLGEPIYNLGMNDNDFNIYRATAIESSGELVEGSNATLCGIVIGKLGYDNAAGGTTRAPYLFGIFDLPENK